MVLFFFMYVVFRPGGAKNNIQRMNTHVLRGP
jgi:hypothetical protein